MVAELRVDARAELRALSYKNVRRAPLLFSYPPRAIKTRRRERRAVEGVEVEPEPLHSSELMAAPVAESEARTGPEWFDMAEHDQGMLPNSDGTTRLSDDELRDQVIHAMGSLAMHPDATDVTRDLVQKMLEHVHGRRQ